MKKKLLALVMAMTMILALAACGNPPAAPNASRSGSRSGDPSGSTSQPPADSSSTDDQSQPEGPELDTFKVGAIYINSQNDTAGYTYQQSTP